MQTKQISSEADIRAAYHQGEEAVVLLFQKTFLELRERLQKVEDQLSKNSSNSGKPPSTDGYEKPAPKSRRKRSGKKNGGQPGHVGHTLKMVEKPDKIVIHPVESCAHCQKSLKKVEAAGVEKRQVLDLPEVHLLATEHQAEIKTCPDCHKFTKAAFPIGVTQAVQYGKRIKSQMVYFHEYQLLPLERTTETIHDLYNQDIAEDTILSACHELAKKVAPVQEAVKDYLTYAAEVAQFDESGARVTGKLHWFHVSCTERLTYYAVHAKRGKIAMNAIGILPNFKGRAIHDDLPSYFRYECDHGLCNAHHLRSLEFLLERHPQAWVKKFKELLLETQAAVAKAVSKAKTRLSAKTLANFSSRYDAILRQGFKQCPSPAELEGQKRKRGRPKQTFAKNLLDRLRDHKEAVLVFMYDFNVPFENNLAERDIRMLKVKQKISGCFRTFHGAEIFCILRGYISTARKNDQRVLDALHSAFCGQPYYPAFTSLSAE
ncbi:MAG: IS66 family transposase [Anaerolineales bacterium]|nr:IS66 family transposase [Anaerolineales bacterium]